MDNSKIITSEILLNLNKEAIRTNRNRALDSGWLAKNLDADGLHLIEQVLLHNDMEWRCQVFIKTRNSMEPTTAWLDVSMERWAGIEKADGLIRALLADAK
jgi:hypothetical protein